PDAIRQNLQNWVGQHPTDAIFSVPLGQYTGKPIPTSLQNMSDYNQKARLLYLEGYKTNGDWLQWGVRAAAAMAQDHYQAVTDNAIGKLTGSGSTGQQLTNLLS